MRSIVRTGRVALLAVGVLSVTLFAQRPTQVPSYEVDPSWPKPLPNRWILGAVAGVAVDKRGSRLDYAPPVHAAAERDSIDLAGPRRRSSSSTPTGLSSRPGAARERVQVVPARARHLTSTTAGTCGSAPAATRTRDILKFTHDGGSSCRLAPGAAQREHDTENLGAPANVIIRSGRQRAVRRRWVRPTIESSCSMRATGRLQTPLGGLRQPA